MPNIILYPSTNIAFDEKLLADIRQYYPGGIGMMWQDDSRLRIWKNFKPEVFKAKYADLRSKGIKPYISFSTETKRDNVPPFVTSNGIGVMGEQDSTKDLVDHFDLDLDELQRINGKLFRWLLGEHKLFFLTGVGPATTVNQYGLNHGWLNGLYISDYSVIKTNLVYVYGSLKRGFSNHDYHMSKARFICETEVPGFNMHRFKSHDSYPCIVRSDNPVSTIKVEAYHVNARELKVLHRLEGVPTFYDFDCVRDIHNSLGIIYFMRMSDRLNPEPIPNGKWEVKKEANVTRTINRDWQQKLIF